MPHTNSTAAMLEGIQNLKQKLEEQAASAKIEIKDDNGRYKTWFPDVIVDLVTEYGSSLSKVHDAALAFARHAPEVQLNEDGVLTTNQQSAKFMVARRAVMERGALHLFETARFLAIAVAGGDPFNIDSLVQADNEHSQQHFLSVAVDATSIFNGSKYIVVWLFGYKWVQKKFENHIAGLEEMVRLSTNGAASHVEATKRCLERLRGYKIQLGVPEWFHISIYDLAACISDNC